MKIAVDYGNQSIMEFSNHNNRSINTWRNRKLERGGDGMVRREERRRREEEGLKWPGGILCILMCEGRGGRSVDGDTWDGVQNMNKFYLLGARV